jgi:hypothetical protein
MSRILVLARDERFRESCCKSLDAVDHEVKFAATEEDALKNITTQESTDLVVIYSQPDDGGHDKMLETLRTYFPQVGIVIAAPVFSYWNDFRDWIADACVVADPELAQLRRKVDEVLSLRRGSSGDRKPDQLFSVDWS